MPYLSWWWLLVSGGGAEGREPDRPAKRASDSFDARDRVNSPAAYELHCRATAESAVYGHPGFVPGTFLDGLDDGIAVAVADLCSAEVWEPTVGGYRILDRDAVQRCLDLACLLRWEEARMWARIRER